MIRNIVADNSVISYYQSVETIGEQIKSLREKKGWSQTELGIRADKTNIETIVRAEANENIGIKKLYKIANALGVKIGALIPEDEREAASDARSTCPDNNPLHTSYHKMLEDIWHVGDQSIGNCIIKIIGEYWPNTASLQAREEKNKLTKEKRAASN
jgi:transcriptional regulator with XRE-family HTH domain